MGAPGAFFFRLVRLERYVRRASKMDTSPVVTRSEKVPLPSIYTCAKHIRNLPRQMQSIRGIIQREMFHTTFVRMSIEISRSSRVKGWPVRERYDGFVPITLGTSNARSFHSFPRCFLLPWLILIMHRELDAACLACYANASRLFYRYIYYRRAHWIFMYRSFLFIFISPSRATAIAIHEFLHLVNFESIARLIERSRLNDFIFKYPLNLAFPLVSGITRSVLRLFFYREASWIIE